MTGHTFTSARPTNAFRCRTLREHEDRPSYPISYFLSILLDVEGLVGNLVGSEHVEDGHDSSCEFEV